MMFPKLLSQFLCWPFYSHFKFPIKTSYSKLPNHISIYNVSIYEPEQCLKNLKFHTINCCSMSLHATKTFVNFLFAGEKRKDRKTHLMANFCLDLFHSSVRKYTATCLQVTEPEKKIN